MLPAQAQIGPIPPPPFNAGSIIQPVVNIVNRGSATSSTVLISVPADGGTPVYRINYYLYFSENPIQPPADFSDTVSFSWTEVSGTSTAYTSAPINTVGTLATEGVIIARPNPGSNINYSVAHGFAGGANYFYTLTVIVEKLN